MAEMQNIFTATPRSTFALLAQPGLGYYIPAYQRPYSWKRSNTEDLIDDVVHGINMLNTTAGESITFLGTMILIHDVKYQTVAPQVKGDLPTRVMLIIDGQQRITTLLLLNAALHEQISARISTLSKKGAEQDFGLVWIRQRALQTQANLAMTLFQDMNYGEGELQYYPRSIRAYEDTWARNKRDARYKSPVALFLHNYGVHSRGSEGRQFQLELPDGGNYEPLATNHATIRRQLRSLAKGETEDMPDPSAIGLPAQEGIFQEALPPEVVSILHDASSSKDRMAGAELLRLVLFARYLLERVAVTEVVAKDDQYAFDIFEALNTTGQPLTAYDTFKPRVIIAEGLDKYEASPSFVTMRSVEDYLSEYDSASDKHRATTQLLIPFASAETGKKLSKKLSEQRQYLQDEYEKANTASGLDGKREFVRHLSHAAEFLRRVWPEASGTAPAVGEFDMLSASDKQLTLFCLHVLRSAKHRITIGPLVRFFSRLLLADAAEKQQAAHDLAGAIRAMAGFFGLWRGSRAGTANIDQQYRLLMSRGFNDDGPFARRPDNGRGAPPTLSRLRNALRTALRSDEGGGIAGKEGWVRKAVDYATFDAGMVTQLILFAATNNSTPDTEAGLITAGRPGTFDLLTTSNWDDFSVEHIAPQKRTGSWEAALYDDNIHRLGNLTLLPTVENSSVSNRPWEYKRLFYRVLSTPTLETLKEELAAAKRGGVEVPLTTEAILSRARLHPQLASIANVQGPWTKDLVDKRSNRLAELAWDQLVPWLGMAPGDKV